MRRSVSFRFGRKADEAYWYEGRNANLFKKVFSSENVEIDLTPTRRPFVEGCLTWKLHRNFHMTLVSEVEGSSPEDVTQEVRGRALAIVQAEDAGSFLATQASVSKLNSRYSRIIAPLLSQLKCLDCTARISIKGRVNKKERCVALTGAEIFLSDAWMAREEFSVGYVWVAGGVAVNQNGGNSGAIQRQNQGEDAANAEKGHEVSVPDPSQENDDMNDENDFDESEGTDLLVREEPASLSDDTPSIHDQSSTVGEKEGPLTQLLKESVDVLLNRTAEKAKIIADGALREVNLVSSTFSQSTRFDELFLNAVCESGGLAEPLGSQKSMGSAVKLEYVLLENDMLVNPLPSLQATLGIPFLSESHLAFPLTQLAAKWGRDNDINVQKALDEVIAEKRESIYFTTSVLRAQAPHLSVAQWHLIFLQKISSAMDWFWSQLSTRKILLACGTHPALRLDTVATHISTCGMQTLSRWYDDLARQTGEKVSGESFRTRSDYDCSRERCCASSRSGFAMLPHPLPTRNKELAHILSFAIYFLTLDIGYKNAQLLRIGNSHVQFFCVSPRFLDPNDCCHAGADSQKVSFIGEKNNASPQSTAHLETETYVVAANGKEYASLRDLLLCLAPWTSSLKWRMTQHMHQVTEPPPEQHEPKKQQRPERSQNQLIKEKKEKVDELPSIHVEVMNVVETLGCNGFVSCKVDPNDSTILRYYNSSEESSLFVSTANAMGLKHFFEILQRKKARKFTTVSLYPTDNLRTVLRKIVYASFGITMPRLPLMYSKVVVPLPLGSGTRVLTCRVHNSLSQAETFYDLLHLFRILARDPATMPSFPTPVFFYSWRVTAQAWDKVLVQNPNAEMKFTTVSSKQQCVSLYHVQIVSGVTVLGETTTSPLTLVKDCIQLIFSLLPGTDTEALSSLRSYFVTPQKIAEVQHVSDFCKRAVFFQQGLGMRSVVNADKSMTVTMTLRLSRSLSVEVGSATCPSEAEAVATAWDKLLAVNFSGMYRRLDAISMELTHCLSEAVARGWGWSNAVFEFTALHDPTRMRCDFVVRQTDDVLRRPILTAEGADKLEALEEVVRMASKTFVSDTLPPSQSVPAVVAANVKPPRPRSSQIEKRGRTLFSLESMQRAIAQSNRFHSVRHTFDAVSSTLVLEGVVSSNVSASAKGDRGRSDTGNAGEEETPTATRVLRSVHIPLSRHNQLHYYVFPLYFSHLSMAPDQSHVSPEINVSEWFSDIVAKLLSPSVELEDVLSTTMRPNQHWDAIISLPSQYFGLPRGNVGANVVFHDSAASKKSAIRGVVRELLVCTTCPDFEKIVVKGYTKPATSARVSRANRGRFTQVLSFPVPDEEGTEVHNNSSASLPRAHPNPAPRDVGGVPRIIRKVIPHARTQPTASSSMLHALLTMAQRTICEERNVNGKVAVHLSRLGGVCVNFARKDKDSADDGDVNVEVLHREGIPGNAFPLFLPCAVASAILVATTRSWADVEAFLRRSAQGEPTSDSQEAPWSSLFTDANQNYRLCCTTFFKRYVGLRVYEAGDIDSGSNRNGDGPLDETQWLSESVSHADGVTISLFYRGANNSSSSTASKNVRNANVHRGTVRRPPVPFSKTLATAAGANVAWQKAMGTFSVGHTQDQMDAEVMSYVRNHAEGVAQSSTKNK